MAYTTQDLASIQRAIASGSRVVQFGDRRREYRSLDELRQIARDIQVGIEGDDAPRRVLSVRTSTRKAI